MHKAISPLFLLAIVAATAFSTDRFPDNNKGHSNQTAEGVKASELQEMILNKLCMDGTYFRECYSIESQECRSVMSKAVGPCVRQETRNHAASSNIRLTDRIDDCVGKKAKKYLQGDQVEKALCKEPNALF